MGAGWSETGGDGDAGAEVLGVKDDGDTLGASRLDFLRTAVGLDVAVRTAPSTWLGDNQGDAAVVVAVWFFSDAFRGEEEEGRRKAWVRAWWLEMLRGPGKEKSEGEAHASCVGEQVVDGAVQGSFGSGSADGKKTRNWKTWSPVTEMVGARKRKKWWAGRRKIGLGWLGKQGKGLGREKRWARID